MINILTKFTKRTVIFYLLVILLNVIIEYYYSFYCRGFFQVLFGMDKICMYIEKYQYDFRKAGLGIFGYLIIKYLKFI